MQTLQTQATHAWKKTTDAVFAVGDHVVDILAVGLIREGETRALGSIYNMGYGYWVRTGLEMFASGSSFYLSSAVTR